MPTFFFVLIMPFQRAVGAGYNDVIKPCAVSLVVMVILALSPDNRPISFCPRHQFEAKTLGTFSEHSKARL